MLGARELQSLTSVSTAFQGSRLLRSNLRNYDASYLKRGTYVVSMLISELRVALQKYNINMSGSVIRRLASDGVISPPPRYPKEEGMGRGGPSNWPEQSIGEIVAFWVLTHDRMYGATPKSTIRGMRRDWYRLIDRAEDVIGLRIDEDGLHGHNPFLFYPPIVKDEFSFILTCRQPFARWIATVQKVEDGRTIDEPIWFLYWWVVAKDQYNDAAAMFEPPPFVEKTGPEDHVSLLFSRRRRPQRLVMKKEAQT